METTDHKRIEASRKLYVIALEAHGPSHWTDAERKQRGEQCYPDNLDPNSLVFHESPWHWALWDTLGQGYWWHDPSLLEPNATYQAEAAKPTD